MKEVFLHARARRKRKKVIYPFECQECGCRTEVWSQPLQPPPAPICCGYAMWRVFGCQINTAQCKDASHIPENKRVVRSGVVSGKGTVDPFKEEQRFGRHISERRKELTGHQKGAFRHTHSVPADLYHGKIRETGDKQYWQDPKNVARHRDCKVS